MTQWKQFPIEIIARQVYLKNGTKLISHLPSNNFNSLDEKKKFYRTSSIRSKSRSVYIANSRGTFSFVLLWSVIRRNGGNRDERREQRSVPHNCWLSGNSWLVGETRLPIMSVAIIRMSRLHGLHKYEQKRQLFAAVSPRLARNPAEQRETSSRRAPRLTVTPLYVRGWLINPVNGDLFSQINIVCTAALS